MGDTLGLEAIIRKALMGEYDTQREDRSAPNAVNPQPASVPATVPGAEGRNEESYSLPGSVTTRSHPAPETTGNTIGLEAIIRKALMGKYDDQAEDRSAPNAVNPQPASVPATVPGAEGRNEDSYSLPGSTPFPCNPLTMTMRFPGGMVSSAQSPGQGQGQGRAWDEEPKPLLCSQYETLSDSE